MSKQNNNSYQFGPYRLDVENRALFRDERAVPLTPKIVEISGAGVSPGADGFEIQADNCVVRGFVINRFPGAPGDIGNGVSLNGSNNSILEGNFLGTDGNGTGALANEFGVFIAGGTGNRVGGTAGAARNLMSGNSRAGIDKFGGTSANVVQGNFMGTDVTGNSSLP
jgi:hypothetical protein